MHQSNRTSKLQDKRSRPQNLKSSSNLVRTFFAAIAMLLAAGYLGTNLGTLQQTQLLTIRLISLSLIFILIFSQIHQFNKEDKPAFIIAAVSLSGCFTSFASLNILFIFLLILSARKISTQHLASISTFIIGLIIIGVLLSIKTGALQTEIDITGLAPELSDDYRIRSTFGFKNVNAFASLVSAFCLLLMLTWKRTAISCLTSLIISYTFYTHTDSRALLLSTLFFVAFMLIFLTSTQRGNLLATIALATITAPILLTLLSPIISKELPTIDAISSYRFSYNSLYLSEIPAYSFIIGGAQPSERLTVDNSFSLLVGAIGLPMLGYVSARFMKIIRECIVTRDAKRYSFLLSFWIFSFLESNMIRPESLIGVIFWLHLFHSKSSQKISSMSSHPALKSR